MACWFESNPRSLGRCCLRQALSSALLFITVCISPAQQISPSRWGTKPAWANGGNLLNNRFEQLKIENRGGDLICNKCKTVKYFSRAKIQKLNECICDKCLKKDKPTKPKKPKIIYKKVIVEKIIHRKPKRNKNTPKKTNKPTETVEDILNRKIRKFCNSSPLFSVFELLAKIGPNPRCYLTNDPIDLLQSDTYHLDHIIPKSKGGPNTLDNCGLTTKRANILKNDLELDELVTICKKIIYGR